MSSKDFCPLASAQVAARSAAGSAIDTVVSFLHENFEADSINVASSAVPASTSHIMTSSSTITFSRSRLRAASENLFKTPKLLNRILHFLPILGIHKMGQLSQRLRSDARRHIRNRLDSALLEWVRRPKRLRTFLDRFGAVIGGTFVPLLLLGKHPGSASALQVATPCGVAYSLMVSYFKGIENYSEMSFDFSSGLARRPFRRSTILCGPQAQIERSRRLVMIVESPTNQPVHPILRSYGTVTMNFITARGIYCLYPKLLFRHVAVAHPRGGRSPAGEERILWSWWRMGFTTYRSIADLPFSCGDVCPTVWRSTDDVAVLSIDFGGMDQPEMPNDRMSCTWTFSPEEDLPEVVCPNSRCERSGLMLPRRNGSQPSCPFLINLEEA